VCSSAEAPPSNPRSFRELRRAVRIPSQRSRSSSVSEAVPFREVWWSASGRGRYSEPITRAYILYSST